MNTNKELHSTTNSLIPTIKPNHYNQPTADDIPEAYLQSLKYKPFRFGDYYYLQQPNQTLQQLLDTPTGAFPELLTLVFNRTHQSRYNVFPTLYETFKEVLAFLDKTANEPSYTTTLLFRASKMAGFRFTVSPITPTDNEPTATPFVSGIYFMSYYNSCVNKRPITHTFTIKREHLVSLIDILDNYNRTGFVLRTNYTTQPIKKID